MSHEKGPLLELQQQFLRLLMNGDQQIQSRIIGTKKVPVETRLGIYADAYRFRLIDALGDSYSAVHTLLGDDDFIEMANAYIDHYPSQHFSIRWFGHQLSKFLQQTAPYSDSPVLREMALFEWTLRDVFDAQDFTHLKMDNLLQLPAESWSDLQLEFNPTIQRIDKKTGFAPWTSMKPGRSIRCAGRQASLTSAKVCANGLMHSMPRSAPQGTSAAGVEMS